MNVPRANQGVELWKVAFGIILTALLSVGATHLTIARDVPSREEVQTLTEKVQRVEINVTRALTILEEMRRDEAQN